jgi:aminoglycoside phosphotransferase (APT) family kinase protein
VTIDNSPRIDDHLIAAIAQAFGLTQAGEFALKQIIDVPVSTARRNLQVLAALHKAGVPSCPPVLTPSGDPVVEVDERGYCVLPWLDGSHPEDPDLTLAQAHQLGTVVGRIHDALNHLDPTLGLAPATTRPMSRVVQPDDAIAEARRYQVAAKEAGGPFDQAVVDLLDQRVALIEKHAAQRPATHQPHGPYGWTHGDLQYLHCASRLSELVPSDPWVSVRCDVS